MKYLIKATRNTQKGEIYVWLSDHAQIWDAEKECEMRIYNQTNPPPQPLLNAIGHLWKKYGQTQGPVIGPIDID